MKRLVLKTLLFYTVALGLLTGCNDKWENEQYEHYISFMSPMDYGDGTTKIFVKYTDEGVLNYKLPVIISGTTLPDEDISVNVEVDNDTLAIINKDHFYERQDLYYKQMNDQNFELINPTVVVPAGNYMANLDIKFKLSGLNFKEKWVLPLKISNDNVYAPHPRKNYKNAILRVYPFNDYSGVYQSSSMSIKYNGTGNPLSQNTRLATVVDANTVFFYAGLTEEDYIDREKYKIFVTFNEDNTLTLEANEPSINFSVTGTPEYEINEEKDILKPYLVRKYITLRMEYAYDDITSVPGQRIRMTASGSMTLQRNINTQIPEEDQAYEWHK